jgi:acrylyl-CoA reductase (NADPH)
MVTRDDAKQQATNFVDLRLDDLMEGDVVVRVTHSTVNFKTAWRSPGNCP